MADKEDLHQMKDEKSASKTVKQILFEDERANAGTKKGNYSRFNLKPQKSGSKTIINPLFKTESLTKETQQDASTKFISTFSCIKLRNCLFRRPNFHYLFVNM